MSGLRAAKELERSSPSALSEAELQRRMRALTGNANWDAVKLNAEEKLRNIALGFTIPNLMANFRRPTFGDAPRGDDDDDDIFTQLIRIIMSVIKLPIRFKNMFDALMNASEAVAQSVDGLGKSVELLAKDFTKLILAILSIVFKYSLCILSFVITTIGGCFLVHIITFACYVLYLIFPLTAYFFKLVTSVDIMPLIDYMFEALSKSDDQLYDLVGIHVTKWPDTINRICYTCFGKKVKWREVSADLGALSDLGDLINFDVNQKIPHYLRNAIPPGRRALSNMDAAMN
jgi:hypothetical protein